MKLVIAASGASGSIYLQRLLDQIDPAANEVHLVLSGYAKQVAKQEIGTFKVPKGIAQHGENDMNVPYVSGSAKFDAMVIAPCSMSTIGRIATGSGDSALLRAADVFLKERRKLIVVPRHSSRRAQSCCRPFPRSIAAPLPWSMLSTRLCGGFSIKLVCQAPALIDGLKKLRAKKRVGKNLEDRRLARAMADRVWGVAPEDVGAHVALRS
jgi:flavoprotein